MRERVVVKWGSGPITEKDNMKTVQGPGQLGQPT